MLENRYFCTLFSSRLNGADSIYLSFRYSREFPPTTYILSDILVALLEMHQHFHMFLVGDTLLDILVGQGESFCGLIDCCKVLKLRWHA